MTITTNDGKTFTGADEKEIVRAMRDQQWHLGYQPKVEYMEEVALRVQQMTGEIIPIDAAGFLLALHTIGLITIHGPSSGLVS